MPFTPDSTLYVGRVPWDNSYNDLYFPVNSNNVVDSTTQYSNIRAMCDLPIVTANYTYIRWNSMIKVSTVGLAGGVESFKHRNYVMYQNNNYADKWVFAFIVDVLYINANTVGLVIETDIWQTYLFDIDMSHVHYMERVTPYSDAIYEHLVPEPQLFEADYWETLGNGTDTIEDLDPNVVIVETTASIKQETDPITGAVTLSRLDVNGGIYGGIPHATTMYAFSKDLVEWTFGNFLKNLNSVGAGDAVVNVFVVPYTFLTIEEKNAANGSGSYGGSSDIYRFNRMPNTGSRHTWSTSLTPVRSGALENYTPKNRKLYTYPYYFCRAMVSTGQFVDLKFEKFVYNGEYTDASFDAYCQLSADASITIVPKHYCGFSHNFAYALNYDGIMRVGWNYGAYANWSAQHAVSNALQFAADVAMVGIPVPQAKGAGAAIKTMIGSRAAYAKGKSFARTAGLDRIDSDAIGRMAKRSAIEKGTKDALTPESSLLSLAGLGGLAALAGNIAYQSMQPNAARGNSSINSIYNPGEAFSHHLIIKNMVMRKTFMAKYDMFFSVFGYQYDHLATTSFNARRYYTYYKMHKANFSSREDYSSGWALGCPTDVIDRICEIFENGATVWNNLAYFKNYTIWDSNTPRAEM